MIFVTDNVDGIEVHSYMMPTRMLPLCIRDQLQTKRFTDYSANMNNYKVPDPDDDDVALLDVMLGGDLEFTSYDLEHEPVQLYSWTRDIRADFETEAMLELGHVPTKYVSLLFDFGHHE